MKGKEERLTHFFLLTEKTHPSIMKSTRTDTYFHEKERPALPEKNRFSGGC